MSSTILAFQTPSISEVPKMTMALKTCHGGSQCPLLSPSFCPCINFICLIRDVCLLPLLLMYGYILCVFFMATLTLAAYLT